MGKQTDKKIDRLDEENSDDVVYCYYIYRYIAITLTGVRFTDMIKRNGLSFSILETRNSSGHRKVMDIEMSEGLSGQILLLGREAECTGLSCSEFLNS